ncbi:MAG: protein kinase domain-containing protein, partial [Acidobacteriota bacterium]
MPFIEGEDLADILKREGKLPVPRVMALARTIVSGLAAAHEAGIVHRDLKPANIMVEKSGEALIMDFGVARSASPEPAGTGAPAGLQQIAASAHTVVGSVVGTVEYMAPEQARAQPVDQRADIYAIGLILYDMLLGRKRAEHAKSAIAELTARMQAPPPPLRQIDPSIPESLDRIVAKCVQPDPALRFHTTADLVAEIEALDDNGKPKPIERKLTRKMVLSVAAVFAAIVALTWWFAPGRAPETQPSPVSLLVADFDNRTGEQVFNGALEQTLEKALEGASFINAYPRPQARQIAEQNIKAGKVLNETVSRLVARREMIDVLVVGSLQRDGTGYTLTLRAVSPAAECGTPLATATADAADANSVLKAVGAAAADLRKRLGDTAEESVRLSAASTFTTSSPQAVKTFETGQELLFAGRAAEAYNAFRLTTQEDPNFAQAYSNAGIMARQLGRPQEAQELWKKALALSDRISERERYRMLGSYYLDEAGNYEKAIDNFSTLMKLYPGDRVGSAALALAYFWSLNIPKALEEGKRSLELDKNSAIVRANYALYAMYAGEYDIATTEINKVLAQQPSMPEGYIPLAFAALARGDWAQAQVAYDKMAATGPRGASRASLGLGDMAIYQGRYADAEKILKAGIAADQKAGTMGLLTAKYVALAEAYEGQKKIAAAVDAARTSVNLAGGSPVKVLAAGVLIRARQKADADEVRAFFSQQLTPQARAYGRILQGQGLLLDRQTADAVDAFTEAVKFKDMWLARFNLGVAYAQAGAFAEALGELDRCQKRRGEAAAVFLDEVPSFRYLATLPYWLGKAHDALNATDAARNDYEAFLKVRGALADDPLVADARARRAALPAVQSKKTRPPSRRRAAAQYPAPGPITSR